MGCYRRCEAGNKYQDETNGGSGPVQRPSNFKEAAPGLSAVHLGNIKQTEVEVEQREDPDVQRLNFTTTTEDDVATGHVDVYSADT